jgi:hypothetical protein
MGALKQQGVRVEGCLNQLSVRINSLKGVTSGLQAQLSRLSSGKPFVIMTAGADVTVSPSRRSTTWSTSSSSSTDIVSALDLPVSERLWQRP